VAPAPTSSPAHCPHGTARPQRQVSSAILARVIDRLFVYGTLAPGRPNEHVLADVPGTWQPGTVGGRLLQQGWGAQMGYPAIVLDEHGPRVDGFVFAAEGLSEHWQRLDEFEGAEYARVVTSAALDDGGTVDVHIYVLKDPQPTSG
jgi:gamma-glutamylcyclotransferase (GGCT)/AIG2-like uncharacterized protein YtfP